MQCAIEALSNLLHVQSISAPQGLLNYTMANHDMMARSITPL